MTTPEQPRDLPDDHVGGGEHREREVQAAATALQEAWNDCNSLPPIEFAQYEANILARAVLGAKTPASRPSAQQPCDTCGNLVTVNAVSPSECFCSAGCANRAMEEDPPSADAAMVEELRALLERATTGPWTLRQGYYLSIQGAASGRQKYGDLVTTHTGQIAKQQSIGKDNAALIVAAINALPRLLDLASRQYAGVPEGFVLVPRILPEEVRDAMTDVKILAGVRNETTALDWEEAQEVWDAALAMFEPLPAAPATETGEMA